MVNIIPQPVEVIKKDGSYYLNRDVSINFSSSSNIADRASLYLTKLLQSNLNISAHLNSKESYPRQSSIELKQNESLSIQGGESYRLIVSEENILIEACDYPGFCNAFQSLLGLVHDYGNLSYPIKIPAVEIYDYPAFKWRGSHLDVSRHFFSVEEIKSFIDILAMHKLNVFHWHLTDDQGWRIAIDKYPDLTKVGAVRFDQNGKSYGGYYTKQQVNEIVTYASERAITVVPEIDMPGHVMALLASYPEYSCTGESFQVPSTWGIFDDVLCPGKEATFKLIENVLNEIIELFPGKYIHIGGDECPSVRWKDCPDCQKRIKDENLDNFEALHGYFINRAAKIIKSHSKTPIGWDEILESDCDNEIAVMAWRGINYGKIAAENDYDVFMSPTSHCYFDYYQDKDNEPKAIGGYLPLEKVYEFNPLPPDIASNSSKNILGGQANIWTEYMADFNHVQYMALPRLCALSEKLWSPESKHDYPDFLLRLKTHLKRLNSKNINYRNLL